MLAPVHQSFDSPEDRLAGLIADAGSVVALTGAGVSVASGIPDFRTPGTGLWENVDPMAVAHIDVWREDPVEFWRFYGQRFATLDGVAPNAAHRVLARMQDAGRLDAVVTQNIDGLHQAAGSRDVVEVHGTIAAAVCLACGERVEAEVVRHLIARARDGVPYCGVCGSPLKPDVTLFGEDLPVLALARAQALAEGADLLLCVGSSLVVWPVAGLPESTLAHGGRVAIVTASETPYDGVAAVRLDGDLVAELEAVELALGTRA